MFKKIFKIIGFTLLALIVFVGLYFLFAYTLPKITVEKEPNTKNEITIYILTNGVHTDIVVPLRNEQIDWTQDFPFENTIAKDTTATFLAMGWGDKGFYLETPTWGDLTFRVAYKAAFGLSTAAIHATFYKTLEESETCKKIEISKSQYHRLISYIKKSLITDSNGKTINIKTNANYGNNDAFYEATGSYHLFHTCNTWTNNALKSCGQKSCLWTPFDTGIFYQYNKQ